jgi:hypothetical protein
MSVRYRRKGEQGNVQEQMVDRRRLGYGADILVGNHTIVQRQPLHQADD